MATAREHFALDWIKADLLETLNEAHVALDEFAELHGDETRMRSCLTSMHQVHGTLVMLELRGVTQLADHLEQLAQVMLAKEVDDESAAGQALMQGILELPGYFDELQRGGEDSISTSMPLVNEIRGILGLQALVDPAGGSLREGASDEVIARFNAIGGSEKVGRIRSAYQNVLLSILKGEDRVAAVKTLGKIATGLERVTEGAPLQRQWQAFAEFVTSLTQQSGVLESEVVKLLRRVDLEIKNLAKDGEAMLRKPVNMELVQTLLDGAVERDHSSARVTGLQEAVTRDISNNTLAISGRQALGSAAGALQEDLVQVKDRLDLLVRTNNVDLDELRQLAKPLKLIGSTMSLLGFESSREIVSDQVEAIENLVILGDGDPRGVQSIAAALIQIDENLSSVILGSEQTEVEQITSGAQVQVLREARKDLEHIKQCIVDFVSAHWSTGHLQSVPGKLTEICGALEIIPLKRAIDMLNGIRCYISDQLMQGHRPEWQELDKFADVVSALDYYLERLTDESGSGADDILKVAERSLADLGQPGAEKSVAPEPVLEPEQTEQASTAEEDVIDQQQSTDTEHRVGAEDQEKLDTQNLPAFAEPKLELEQDLGFDLSSDVFGNVEGSIERADSDADADDVNPQPEADTTPDDVVHEDQDEELKSSPPKASETTTDVPEMQAADPEIVEIFVEEVEEVLHNIAEYLPQWAGNFEDADALAEIRRAFHTLKGSGRIVHAAAIGELAWGVENMLNRIIDGTITANSQFVAVIDAARKLVPDLSNAFKQGKPSDLEAIGRIIEQADILSSGGEIDSASAPVEVVSEAHEPEQAADAGTGIEDAAEEAGAEPILEPKEESGEVALTEPVDEQRSTVDLFIAEAREHLSVVEAENARVPWSLSEPMARAFHTLAGGAALAELQEVELIVVPAYQVVEAFRNSEPSDALQQFFVSAAGHLSSCLMALTNSQDWEEPLEFVALADDLMATRNPARRPVELLLDAPGTAALFSAEAELADYLASSPSGDHSFSTKLQAELHELAGLADDMKATPLSQLATAFAQALALSSDVGRNTPGLTQMPSRCADVMRQAYDQLIHQLNEIAAGSEIAEQEELVAVLRALDFEPAVQEAAQKAAQEDTVEIDEEVTQEESTAEKTELEELAEVDADLVQVFFEEAEEINEELESSIVRWSSERENRIYMENMLRGLHTLKGGARLCGLSKLGDMAHDFESVVVEVQSEQRAVDDALFVELNRRYDDIVKRLSQVSTEFNNASHFVATDNVVDLPSADTAQSQPSVSDVNMVVEATVAQSRGADANQTPDTTPADLPPKPEVTKATERGNSEMVRVGSSLLEELVNLAGESSILRARIEQGMSDFTGALDEMETTIERLREQLRRLEIETETQILHRHERSDSPQYDNFDPLEMDRYNQMQQLSRSLSESASDMTDLKETLLFKARESETLLLQQARINTELQEGLMRTRMVPFSRLVPRLRRIVRQVSNELEKTVEFHVQNAEGELDRNLLERMVPPLEHMLRNAVDHGIESSELRRNYGKPETGRIDLRLTREGGDVVIEINDDGAGIDVESVRAKAIESGLMAADADMTDEEVLQFVLAPGFTTTKSVTQISGRGVGLDVVHSEVKQLGGSVNIVSHAGKGTRFVLRVPFTVSVNRALMVSVSEDLYAIPLNTIEGIVLLSPEQLQALYHGEGKTFEYAGVPYRVRYLGQYLGREYRSPIGGQTSVPMVLVRSGDHAVAVHVDMVQGSREIVVKSLGPQFAGVGGISGATILGDGSVVVILDLLALIRAQHNEGTRREAAVYTSRTGPRCVMVVDDSVTVRKVTSRLLERQGMEVLVAKDGIEAVAMLQERRPDVILLDIEMPRMDGFEVARQVRHDKRLSKLPIVMISSRTGDKHKEHASQLGVNKFLGKPFQENELLATIDEVVRRD